MSWAILLVLAIVAVVTYSYYRWKTAGASNEPEVSAGMSMARRRVVALFFLALGLGLIYMEISLLSINFPETPRVPEPRVLESGTNSQSQQQGELLQASAQTDGAANPAPQNSPTPVPHPLIEYVLPQSAIGNTPNMWLTIYGRNFSNQPKIRLNGREVAVRKLSANLLATQLSAAELVDVGTLSVDVVDDTNRISNAILVPVANPKVPLNVFSLDRVIPWKPYINREVQLLLIAIFAGALGSYIHLLRSFTTFIGNGRLTASWFWFYMAGPFVAMAMALIFYAVLRGGFLAGTPADEKVVNPFGVLAVSALVGMFTDRAGLKLKEVFDTLFKAADDRGDKLEELNTVSKAEDTRAGTKITSPATLPDATTNTAYSQTIKAADGKEPYKWSLPVNGGAGWLSINPSTGELTGTPTTAGSVDITIKVEDANAVAAEKGYKLVVK